MALRAEKIPLEQGGTGTVWIEVHELAGVDARVARGDKAAKTFEAAWSTVQPVIQRLAAKIAECGPTEVQIKFGIKISTELNAIIAGTKGEGNFEVTLSWKSGSTTGKA